MKESTLVSRILRDLAAAGAKVVKCHGSPFFEAGTPDLLGCYRGRALAIECKVGFNKPTAIQSARLRQWAEAGALTAVAREDFDVEAFLTGKAR